MKFIVKFFPEITIKSKPVRRQFVSQLANNLRTVLKRVDPNIKVQKDWDKLVLTSELDPAQGRSQLADAIGRVPGISWYLDVLDYPLGDFDDILQHTRRVYEPRLPGKTFAVRCKRAGRHEFRSIDVERYVGGGLNQHCDSAGVNLSTPDITVALEIRDDRLYVVNERHKGLGGFPIGSLDPVLSLISGGFDSTVSSYLTMKRGLRTHFCFFNLGGRDHEIGVKEVALYLWLKYGCGQRVRFVSVPFAEVVAELLNEIDDSQMGVILKRMMLRAATQIADQLSVDALVTGESVAQVSSQTLRNLAVIDAATDKLVLRPLITSDKEDIIRLAAQIGTEQFAAAMPEYCGIISVNPTTRARPERIAGEEAHFDFGIIDRAVAAAVVQNIDEIAEEELCRSEVEVLGVPLTGAVIIDIRHPNEAKQLPLKIHAEVLTIPFYELHSRMQALDRGLTYMLYCEQGVMSKLQAGHLVASGYGNIKVYRPQA
ncbi:MAG: tRNA 4-thiouridine(8) synthase ThiI [Gammaproteobacteria bacterium]|nr:tRNA 4-thiouridine(8) synthase ThiI [Gammaproteobacteria bacterium]